MSSAAAISGGPRIQPFAADSVAPAAAQTPPAESAPSSSKVTRYTPKTSATRAPTSQAPTAAEVLAGAASITYGMKGDAVVDLQRWLVKQGADLYVDGHFGEGTLEQLKKIQSRLKASNAELPITPGVVDAAMQKLIDSTSFKVPAGFEIAPSGDDVRAGKATLKRGMAGPAVAELQRKLNACGIKPPLVVDGLMGPFTERALLYYQQAVGGAVAADAKGLGDAKTFALLDKKFTTFTKPMKPYFQDAVRASRSSALESRVRGMYAGGDYNAANESKYLDEAVANETSQDRADLARAAVKSALANRTIGRCARGVRMALAQVGVHEQVPSAYLYADRLAARKDFQEISVPDHDLSKLPPGCVVVYGRSNAHPDGHVTISLGGGKEASDHIQNTVNPTRYGDVRVFLPT